MVRSGWVGEHGRHGQGLGVRLPLQGGLPPVGAVAGAVVEIACDESGFSGTNLLHPSTPVITHASVDLCVGEAVGLVAALRSGFRCSPKEFKSGQFLRSPQAGEAREWFLAALRGRAHVHLVDKEDFQKSGQDEDNFFSSLVKRSRQFTHVMQDAERIRRRSCVRL